MAFLVKIHCVKSVRIWSFSGSYFPIFSSNVGKYGPEKLQIWTLFTQRLSKFASALKNTNKFEATALYVTYPKITEVKTMYESKSVNDSH